MDRQKKKKFPTLFVLEGSIQMYDGSMLELHTKLDEEQWLQIVKETIEYYVFIKALQQTGMPAIRERWTPLCQYFLEGLEVSVSRMRNIDPLLVTKHDQEELLRLYTAKMEEGAKEALVRMEQILKEAGGEEGPDVDVIMVPNL